MRKKHPESCFRLLFQRKAAERAKEARYRLIHPALELGSKPQGLASIVFKEDPQQSFEN